MFVSRQVYDNDAARIHALSWQGDYTSFINTENNNQENIELIIDEEIATTTDAVNLESLPVDLEKNNSERNIIDLNIRRKMSYTTIWFY